MNTKTAFSSAIQLLTADDIDYRSIVIRLAQVNPALFVKLATPADKTKPVEPSQTSRYNMEWARNIWNNISSDTRPQYAKVVRAVVRREEGAAQALFAVSPNGDLTDENIITEFTEWLNSEYKLRLPTEFLPRHSDVNPGSENYLNTLCRLKAVYMIEHTRLM